MYVMNVVFGIHRVHKYRKAAWSEHLDLDTLLICLVQLLIIMWWYVGELSSGAKEFSAFLLLTETDGRLSEHLVRGKRSLYFFFYLLLVLHG